eukprot:SAG31_NODE_2673_length_5268_cov_2.551944_9_plen_37_part_00
MLHIADVMVLTKYDITYILWFELLTIMCDWSNGGIR